MIPKYTAIVFASLLAGCISKSEIPSYILSSDMDVQTYERVDHRFCSSVDSGNNKKGLDNSYWQCRLSLTKYRLKTDKFDPNFQTHNRKISDLATQISLKISLTTESSLAKINNEIDNLDHVKCLDMGFAIDTDDQLKINDYFSCRRFLLEERISFPPFDKLEYLKYRNQDYNMSYIVNKRIDQNISSKRFLSEKYPTCMKHNIYSKNFINCKKAQESSRQCFAQINSKKLKSEVKKKVICQKESFHKFPESLLLKEEGQQDSYQKINRRSDFYNNNSFASIGIEDLSQFRSDNGQDQLDAKNKVEDINSKTRLYNRFELTKLRQKYIILCQKNVDNEIIEYVKTLQSDCSDLKKYKLLSD